MQEHTNRAEPLSEELLEAVTGAGGGMSTSRNSGPGSFLNCPSCQIAYSSYDDAILWRQRYQYGVDAAVNSGNRQSAEQNLAQSTEMHQKAQEQYQQMTNHGRLFCLSRIQSAKTKETPGITCPLKTA
jgi:hypothetical protein